MKRRNWLLPLGLAASLLPTAPAMAADHQDGASVLTDASTDINDVYSWVSADGKSMYLIMTVNPNANKATTKFSNAAYYVFHTNSRAANAVTAAPNAANNVDIVCGFDAAQKASCWVGDSTNFLYGDASSAATPLTMTNNAGTFNIFAGPRKDHFFFNLDGFKQLGADVRANKATLLTAKNLTNGCPNTNVSAIMTAGLSDLSHGIGGAPAAPVDHFIGFNALAIAVQVPITVVNKGGPIVSVWAGTYRKG